MEHLEEQPHPNGKGVKMATRKIDPAPGDEFVSVKWRKDAEALHRYHSARQRGADAVELRMLYEALRKRVHQARRIC